LRKRIGRVCQKLRSIGKLDPKNPRQYNPEGVKVSLDNFEKGNNIQSIPLYAFGSWLERNRGL
jgi:hypothetical protein